MKSLDPTQPTLVLPDPLITLQGKSFTLSVLESVLDNKQKVRYVTAKIINHEGYARFIIDDSTGELVGHLDIDGSVYRILPRELSKHQQLIYKFDSDRLGKAEESRSIMVSSSENASVYRLERELLKTEAIHSIAPVYYNETLRAQGRGVDLLGGNIGRIDVDKVLKRDVSEISKLLIQLKAITDAKDSFSYVMDKIAGNTDPHPSSLDPDIFNPVQSQKIDDVVVHEATHAIMESSNPDFSNAVADNEPLAEGFLFTHPLKTFYATSFPLAT